MTADRSSRPRLIHSDGITAARTMIAVDGNATALQRRLPSRWALAPCTGDDLRGTVLRGAPMLVPFHEVHAANAPDAPAANLLQVSDIAIAEG
jgi:hypothetical protein